MEHGRSSMGKDCRAMQVLRCVLNNGSISLKDYLKKYVSKHRDQVAREPRLSKSKFEDSDISPPRKRQHSVARSSLSDVSRRSHPSFDPDLSPPRKKSKELSIPASVNERKAGLISGKDIREEIDKKKKEDLLRSRIFDIDKGSQGIEKKTKKKDLIKLYKSYFKSSSRN